MPKKISTFLLIVFSIHGIWSQEIKEVSDIDTRYFEDQFYGALTYNLLANRPSGVSQNSFSYGLQLGFIKDIPLNSRRNVALGLGVGYVTASYYHNLKATQNGDDVVYSVLGSETVFSVNKIETHGFELPLEIRWRTSTPDQYKFWRVYIGAKLGYAFSTMSKFVDDNGKIKFSNDDINKLSTGLTLSLGYNTWNFHVYYGINGLLDNATVTETGEQIDMRAVKVGLIFYIL